MFSYLEKYFSELWFLVLEMAPWLLLGLIFAGLLKVYFPQEQINRFLGRSNFRSALNAALIGIPMPLCSCGVIPTGISFFKNGASRGATNSFMISTPQTGVDSILATYSMLGWPFALLRPFVALITGISGGVLTHFFTKKTTAPEGQGAMSVAVKEADLNASGSENDCCSDPASDCCGPSGEDRRHSLVRAADYAFIELLQDIAKWLIIGFLLAAFISVALPAEFFSSFQGLGIVELLLILAASVPLYICATGSIPVAAVLLMKGVSPGAALVFLMAGPATNIATMTVLGKTMGRRSLMTYLGTIIGGALIFGLLVNHLIPADLFLNNIVHMHGDGTGHEMLPAWLQWASALLLIFSMAGGYFYTKIQKSKKMRVTEGITVKVTGMTCSHCEANVKRNLEVLDGITHVVADNSSETVKITGEAIDLKKVEATVNGLGYKYVG